MTQQYERVTDELHRWAFSELMDGNTQLARRIIAVVTKRRLNEKTWLESLMEIDLKNGGEFN